MNAIFSSILDTIRTWLGLDRPLHPSHGWLLPVPALVRARAVAHRAPRGTRR